jgi:ribosomal protein S18 acetylase RimI-like enzyme
VGLSKTDEQYLDNVAWHALRGRQAEFARSDDEGVAVGFDPEVNVFCAVDRLDEADAWPALARLVGPAGFVVLARDEVPSVPEGWDESFRDCVWQMVAQRLDPAPEVVCGSLGRADADDMVALAQLTEPGPFLTRTVELGGYVGVREDGRLLAMAGERMKLPGLCEVSAVCVHPDAQRRGLGGALTLRVAHGILARGEQPFLHVLESNETAIRLYEAIGFVKRRKLDVVSAQWTAA